MKIIHVVRQFSPSVGGLEDSVLSVAFEQRAMGIDAQVITLNTVFNREGYCRLVNPYRVFRSRGFLGVGPHGIRWLPA